MQSTEMRNEKTKNIDSVSTIDMLKMISDENFIAVKAVEDELLNISKAVDVIAQAIKNGGRLIYIGAGTSGRLGVLDAAECPPTFGVDKNTVIGIIAGGEKCLSAASENGEDIYENGILDVKNISLNKNDVLVGVSAAGNAAYVVGAMEYAKSLGCFTISLTSNEICKINEVSNLQIITNTGAEAITGSTRLKAGTAQKLVLNMLSTGAMVKTDKVYENYMINVKPVNIKLENRCIDIIQNLANVDFDTAKKSLNMANGDIKTAIKYIKGE